MTQRNFGKERIVFSGDNISQAGTVNGKRKPDGISGKIRIEGSKVKGAARKINREMRVVSQM